MNAVIVNFRSSRKRQETNHMVIKVEGVSDRKKAETLVGKKVVWTSPAGKKLEGKIAAAHGNSGAVRAIFTTGMPGQSVGTKIEIL